MDARRFSLATLAHYLHAYFIWFLVGSYVVAALWPTPGLAIRAVRLGELSFRGERSHVTLPMLMLAALLLNAGLGMQTGQMRGLLRSPRFLVGGLAANLFIPVAFIFVVSQVMRLWHNPVEVQEILVGLALVAAMPIAGSSTAWTQNANGDLALSLGLVLFSTFLSPVTTPMIFDLVEYMAHGKYAQALDDLEGQGTGVLLIFFVLLPVLLGIVLHFVLGTARIQTVKPNLKLANSLNLLLLNYSNAAVSLPQTIADPDWDFLAVTLAIVVGLCALLFGSGYALARLTRANPAQRASLMFGLGMNNNGTGLVLASMVLADFPRVFLPVIFYNLVQHLAAGTVDFLLLCQTSEEEPEP